MSHILLKIRRNWRKSFPCKAASNAFLKVFFLFFFFKEKKSSTIGKKKGSGPVWFMYLKTEICCIKIFVEIRVSKKVC